MSKKPKQQSPPTQRRCIFCGDTPITSEHLWSEWIEPLLELEHDSSTLEAEGGHFKDEHGNIKFGRRFIPRKGTRPGSARFDALCGQCNNVWGGSIETASQPALTRLIGGENHTLSPEDQRLIVKWLTLKFFVVECEKAQATLEEERRAFRTDGGIPSNLRIWIGPLAGKKWRVSFECFVTSVFFGTRNTPLEPDGKRNVVSFTFGVGSFLAYAVYARVANPPTFMRPPNMIQIWPYQNGSIQWPSEMIGISDSEADALNKSMEASLQASGRPIEYRRLSKLKVVLPLDDASIYAGINPYFVGNEMEDLGCGNCDTILVRGLSINSVRDMFTVPSQFILTCMKCGAHNLLPVRGTKRNRGGK